MVYYVHSFTFPGFENSGCQNDRFGLLVGNGIGGVKREFCGNGRFPQERQYIGSY